MNFRRVKAIGKKEFIQVVRDLRSLMVVLLMPLMQMALLGYGVSLDVRHVPVCVFDREGSQQSESLLKAFQASIYFDIVETDRDYNGVKRAMDAGRCKMAVVVPNDFSQDLVGANAASVQAILDASDDNTANIALGYAQAVVSGFSRNVQLERNSKPWAAGAGHSHRRARPGLVQRRPGEPRFHHSGRGRDRARTGRRATHLTDAVT